MPDYYDFYFDPRLMSGIPPELSADYAPVSDAGLLNPDTYPYAQTPPPRPLGVGRPVEAPLDLATDVSGAAGPLGRATAGVSPRATWGGSIDISSASRQPQVQSAAPPTPVPAQQGPTSGIAGLLPEALRGSGKGGLFGMGSVDMSQWTPNMGLLGAGAALYEGKGYSEAAKAMMAGASWDQKTRAEALKAQRDAQLRQIMANAPRFADGSPDYSGIAGKLLASGADPETIGKFIEFGRKGLGEGQRRDAQGNIVYEPGALPGMREKADASQAAPAGFRRTEAGLEIIKGGPHDPEVQRREAEAKRGPEKVEAELGARVGLARSFLGEVDSIRERVKAGGLSGYGLGGRGSLSAALGTGEAGELRRKIDSGADALLRNLTGAGMGIQEANDYARRYRWSPMDTDEQRLSKLDQLERELRSVVDVVGTGRGGPGKLLGGTVGGGLPGSEGGGWRDLGNGVRIRQVR
jgi:hypothetical protein